MSKEALNGRLYVGT